MKDLVTFIEIDAKPDVVWHHAAAFRHYADWNPFIIGIDGHPMVGERLTVTMKLKIQDDRNQANHVITPTIVKVEDDHEIRWEHGAWFPGMLTIEHWFRITQRKGGVKFHQCMRRRADDGCLERRLFCDVPRRLRGHERGLKKARGDYGTAEAARHAHCQ